MNLLTIYPIQSCNLSCDHCPSKGYVYSTDSPKNVLTNKLIFDWLDKYCPSSKWLIEISGGGEPSLYPEIDSLMKGLNEKGYKGLVRTNGILPIPKTDGFKRVAAWHKEAGDINHPPGYYDIMLIIRSPFDDWRAKVKYCEEHNIPYKTVNFYDFNLPQTDWGNTDDVDETRTHQDLIEFWGVMYSSGQLAKCFSSFPCHLETVQNNCPPMITRVSKDSRCGKCMNVIGFEYFFNP